VNAYLTPGVYRSPAASERPDIGLVRTDVAAFVGFAERGPIVPAPAPLPPIFDPQEYALRITTWDEYRSWFGGFIDYGYMPWAVRAFFENGGTTCFVVRAAASAAANPADRPRAARYTVPASVAATTAIAADAARGSATLTLASPSGIGAGDLVAIRSNGLDEIAQIDAIHDAVITLHAPSLNDHASGDGVTIFRRGFELRATSAGSWGNRIRLHFSALEEGEAVQTFSLRVTADPGFAETHPEEEFFPRMTLADPAAPDHAARVVASSRLVELEPGAGVAPSILLTGGPLATGYARLLGGRDGLATLTTNDLTGNAGDPRGLRLLEDIEDIAMTAIPDAVWRGTPPAQPPPQPAPRPCEPPPEPSPVPPPPPDPTSTPHVFTDAETRQIQDAMIEQCARLRYRLAILDAPDFLHPRQAEAWVDTQQLRTSMSKFAALYYPWLRVPDPSARGERSRRVPPSGHVAGQWAQNDHVHGVQHPPANEPIEYVVDVGETVTDPQQGDLNTKGIDVIRPFPGRGIRIWGARSLSNERQWKFIHVRRLMSYIEESIEKSTQWTVFETHDNDLRRTLVHSLSVFLEGIWAVGGLRGNSPGDAFFVKCDETNNPRASVDAGLLICQVGVSIAVPMEFIVFEVRRSVTGSQVVEA
jgi:hypothetical protein